MIIVSGTIKVKPERTAEAVRAGIEMAATSRSEPGCADYRFGIDIDDPQQLHLFEEWADQGALDLHLATPHFAAFSALVVDVLAEEPTFTRYEAASSGPLFG